MSLLKDFYTLLSFDAAPSNTVKASLRLNKNHPIFAGHFPDQPVTPGVCMMQIIKELGEKWADTPLQLKKARNVKFMAIINPYENAEISIELQFEEVTDGLSIKSTTSFAQTVALKFSGVFQKTSV